jgi:HEAT repeat protein
MAELLTDIGGAQACKLLVRLLGHEDPNVRVASGEGLVDLGYDRYAEVARAIEVEVDRGQDVTALCEVPFLLAELGEPGGVKLCARLLRHKNADVVGAAIEGLAQLGDPSVLKDIEALKADKRVLTVDEESEGAEVTVGELAGEAVAHLRTVAG